MAETPTQEAKLDPFDVGNPAHHTPPPKDPVTGRFVSPGEAPPAEPAGPPPRHPEGLAAQARELGYSDEDMQTMSTPGLRVAVTNSLREQKRLYEQFALQHTLTQPAPARPDAPPAAEDEDEVPDLEGSEWDPRLVQLAKAVKSLREENKKLRAVQGRVGTLEEREARREAKTAEEFLDLAFESLGESYHELFGKGDGAAHKDKAEMKRRRAVINEAGIDFKDLPTLPKLKAKLREATETLYPQPKGKKAGAGAYEEPEEKPASRVSPDDWEQAALARPTHRKGAAEVKGEALAIANLERKLREGNGAVAGDAEILDGFQG